MQKAMKMTASCGLIDGEGILPALKLKSAAADSVHWKKDRHSIKERIIKLVRFFGLTEQ